MKKLLFLLPLCMLVATAILTWPTASNAAGSNPYCVGMSGKFTAVNWPGGTIMVACAGDTGTAGCTGEVATLHPGDSYDFNNCTCPPYSSESIFGKSGCVVIGDSLKIVQLDNGNRPVQGSTALPKGCTLNKPQPIACGSNGTVIKGDFTITCPAPSPTPTATPPPTSCPLPGRVLNVQISCPDCTVNP